MVKSIHNKKALLLALVMALALLSSCTDKDSGKNPAKDLSKPQSDVSMSGKDEYPHDLKKDRKEFDPKNINIVVGDNLYAAKINDWFANTVDYIGQTVEIDGFYVDIGGYSYIGRLGPSCPYCKGGYVSFEFKGDQDLSAFKSGETWIRVQGIIREGNNSIYGPFPYIEAINVIELEEKGLETVAN